MIEDTPEVRPTRSDGHSHLLSHLKHHVAWFSQKDLLDSYSWPLGNEELSIGCHSKFDKRLRVDPKSRCSFVDYDDTR